MERSPAGLQQEDDGVVLRASMPTQATRLQQRGAGAWRRTHGRWRRRRSSDDEAGQRRTRRRPHGLGEVAGNRFGQARVEAEEQRKETRSARRQAWARRPAGRHGEEAAMRGATLGIGTRACRSSGGCCKEDLRRLGGAGELDDEGPWSWAREEEKEVSARQV